MLAKEINYVDFDGRERKDTFYFNLTNSELVEMQVSEKGGLTSLIEKIIAEEDQLEIMKLFKKIILKSYGEKSDDGKYFKKSDEISENFAQSAAYDKLFMDLMSDAEGKEAAKFIEGIMSSPEAKKAIADATDSGVVPMLHATPAS